MSSPKKPKMKVEDVFDHCGTSVKGLGEDISFLALDIDCSGYLENQNDEENFAMEIQMIHHMLHGSEATFTDMLNDLPQSVHIGNGIDDLVYTLRSLFWR